MTEQDLKECIAEVKHSAIPEQSKEKIINTLQDSRWIPCSERLPSGLDFVLFTHKDGEVDTCSIEYFYDYLDKFIAWRPLPEPYKESED